MPHTMTKPLASHEVPICDPPRRMAKAGVTPSHSVLRGVIAELIRSSAEKKEKLAGDMGKDRAQMYRQIENGHLTVENIDALGPDFLVKMAEELLELVGPLATPRARAKEQIRIARRALDELDQATELIA